MKKLSAMLFFTVATLVGCGENTPVQTVDWYKANEPNRREMLAKCKADPGRLGASANCVNALQADNEKANARRGWIIPNAVDFGKKGG